MSKRAARCARRRAASPRRVAAPRRRTWRALDVLYASSTSSLTVRLRLPACLSISVLLSSRSWKPISLRSSRSASHSEAAARSRAHASRSAPCLAITACTIVVSTKPMAASSACTDASAERGGDAGGRSLINRHRRRRGVGGGSGHLDVLDQLLHDVLESGGGGGAGGGCRGRHALLRKLLVAVRLLLLARLLLALDALELRLLALNLRERARQVLLRRHGRRLEGRVDHLHVAPHALAELAPAHRPHQPPVAQVTAELRRREHLDRHVDLLARQHGPRARERHRHLRRHLVTADKEHAGARRPRHLADVLEPPDL